MIIYAVILLCLLFDTVALRAQPHCNLRKHTNLVNIFINLTTCKDSQLNRCVSVETPKYRHLDIYRLLMICIVSLALVFSRIRHFFVSPGNTVFHAVFSSCSALSCPGHRSFKEMINTRIEKGNHMCSTCTEVTWRLIIILISNNSSVTCLYSRVSVRGD